MSSIPNSSPAPSSALFPTNVHAHGHKRGAHADAVGNSSNDATQAPGAVRNLFSSLLQSLEQIVGLQPGAAPPPATASAAAGAGTGTGINGMAASMSGAGAGAIHTANALVQNYLNNLSLKQQSSASQATKPAGSTLNAAA
jgi:hypothetical protein